MAARQAEKERVERAKIEERKRKEVQRITEERKREEERRRQLDGPRHVSRDIVNGTSDDRESVNRSLHLSIYKSISSFLFPCFFFCF